MAAIVVIGDELTGVGFRLAGATTRCPTRTDLRAEFAHALATAGMIVLSRSHADALPPEVLQRALASETPLVVIVPDVVEPQADAAFTRRMRAVLGIET